MRVRGTPKIVLVGFTALLAGSPMAAQQDNWDTPQPEWEGVWQGTVGQLPVHVCLDATPYQQKGEYYYDRVKRLLRLEPDKTEGRWFEQDYSDKNGAQWNISASDGQLVGTWSDGKKELPVRLTRLGGSSKEYEGPCGSMAFLRPRLAPVQLTSKHPTLDGERYTTWTFKPGPWLKDEVEITTFTLDRSGPQIAKINALLRAVLPKADGTGEWFDCVAGNVNWSGRDGTYYKIIEPRLIGKRWMAANEHGEYYCGGAHPDNVNAPRTFDLALGIEVDPLDWFGPKAVHREDLGGEYGIYKTLTPAFIKVVLNGRNLDDSDCDEAIKEQESWSAGLRAGVLVFTPNFPRVIMACGEDFEVPFARLQPWLNGQGKAAIATLPR